MESCHACSKSFIRKSALLQHKEDKHNLVSYGSWTCDVGACTRSFGKESSLWQHKEQSQHAPKKRRARKAKKIKVKSKIGPYGCDICSDGFATESGMQHHRRDKHGSSAASFGGYSHAAQTTWTYRAAPSTPDTSSDSESDEETDSDSSSDIEHFLDSCKPADVHRYISDHLQPDTPYSDECSSVVDHLAHFFKTGSAFTVNRFIKGGSLGKGTAIKSKSDVDLVMFISELPAIGSFDYSDKLRKKLDELENTIERSKQSIAYSVRVVGRTSFAVKLRVQSKKADHEPHDVDLLLASDLLGPSLSNSTKEEVYRRMETMGRHGRETCSAALVELQRDFVKGQGSKVKDPIRLVKMWKSSCVTESSLTSYPLELLCIHTWRSHMSVAAAFKAVLQKLSDYRNISAYWTENYSFQRVQPMLGKRPLILDPANPYNNVADRCRNWDAVARAARETLQKPFFRYV